MIVINRFDRIINGIPIAIFYPYYRKADFIDQESIKRTLKVKQSEMSMDLDKSQGKSSESKIG